MQIKVGQTITDGKRVFVLDKDLTYRELKYAKPFRANIFVNSEELSKLVRY
ncbi:MULTISPECIES: hypothetical protein [Lactobacillus]|uniref:hypothetical protein n=1 Tax=Lactobacillus TaxID=1578 RepID=UPI0013748487|nr:MULTISPECIES: hypothetical protein [Lactobacillus]